MRKALYIIIFTSFFSAANAQECLYTVKSGDWVAKILRDFGSKNPFQDQSYFKTVALNKDVKNIHKLKKGDVIKLVPSFLSAGDKLEHCKNPETARNVVTKTLAKPKRMRLPASTEDDDLFPILEYKAATPKGGAK